MGEVGERDALLDPALEQGIDPRPSARRQGLGIRARTQVVRKPCGKEHEFRSLVARIVGAMAEVHPRAAQLARAALDGCAHGFSGRV